MVVGGGRAGDAARHFSKDKAALLAPSTPVAALRHHADINRAMETLAASLHRPQEPAHRRLQRRQAARGVGRAGEGARRLDREGKLVGKGGDNSGITSFNVRRYVTSPGEYAGVPRDPQLQRQAGHCDVTLSVVLARRAAPTASARALRVRPAPQDLRQPAGRHPAGVAPAARRVRKIVPQLQSDGVRLVGPPSRASSGRLPRTTTAPTPTSRHAAPRRSLRHRAEPVPEALLLLRSAERRREDRARASTGRARTTTSPSSTWSARHEGPARQTNLIRPPEVRGR